GKGHDGPWQIRPCRNGRRLPPGQRQRLIFGVRPRKAGAMMNIAIIGQKAFRASLILISAAALAGCDAGPAAPAQNAEPPLAGARIGGPFTLTDQNGRTVRDTDFAGQYRLVYFGYSFCPDICPVDVQKLMRGLSQFEKSDPAR